MRHVLSRRLLLFTAPISNVKRNSSAVAPSIHSKFFRSPGYRKENMTMHRFTITMLALYALLFAVPGQAQTRDPRLDKINWQQGPSIGNLGSNAEVRIPGGYVFADANDTRVLMEIMRNPTSGKELGFLASTGADWFVVFEFDVTGYIRDDEKNSLDSDAMLESIKSANETANKERTRRGWPALTIVGWEQKPHYNETTHNLEWAIRGQSEGKPVINHNTRILGRRGVMRVTLVVEPSSFAPTLPQFKTLLGGFDFKQGEKYAEYRQGDKLATYGLSALVVGGAAAAAAKTGLFKYIWKLLVVAGAGVLAALKKVFTRKKTQYE